MKKAANEVEPVAIVKNASRTKLSRATRAEHELWTKWNALEGNVGTLAYLLRKGRASSALQQLAADLIEGKVKPRRTRPRASRANRFWVAQVVANLEILHPDRQRKWIIAAAARQEGMSERSIYNALAEFDGVAGVRQIERMRRDDRSDQCDDLVEMRVRALIATGSKGSR